MTTRGILFLAFVGVSYLFWISRLMIRRRLHPVYGAVWVFWMLIGLSIVFIEPLLNWVTSFVGATFPASALTLLAFVLLFGMQIYLLSQLSIVSRRVTQIAQSLAIEKAKAGAQDTLPN
jgi:hypothetical protein